MTDTFNPLDDDNGRIKKQTLLKLDALNYHAKGKPGKFEIHPTKSMLTQRDLSLAYSPGVAFPCLEIAKNPSKAYDYTIKGNLVAVVTNGTAVLGLGNLGALASKPVMEGKSVLFKRFADIDAVDIEVDTIDPEDFINTVKNFAGTFGGINLEDIRSPECFEIEKRLDALVDVPVFHDDQHGTSIIVGAGIINAAEITGRDLAKMKVVVNGCGAAGVSCIEIIKLLGVKNIVVCDQNGVLYKGRQLGMNEIKDRYAIETKERFLEDALVGADVFIGLSVKDVLLPEMLMSMNKDPIIFAMANPDPEIKPELARKARPDAIIATGRSDYNNQVNNVMCFPYIFRGALDARATTINKEMKLAAIYAISKLAKEPVPYEVLQAYSGRIMNYGKEYIIPTPFDSRLITVIAPAVVKAAMETGVARKIIEDLTLYTQEIKSRFSSTSNIFNLLSTRVKNNKKRVIFTEGEDERSIRAAVQWRDSDYGKAILVGKEEKIRKTMTSLGIIDQGNIEIMNAAISIRNDAYIKYMYERLQRKGYIYRACVREVKTDRNVFAACMLACGDGDVLITGLTRNYRSTLNDMLNIVDHKDVVFGLSIVVVNNNVIFVADTAINNNPSANELANIAIHTANKSREMGYEPRVAFIGHSSFGNEDSCETEKIRKAIDILTKMNVNFEFDGEMNVDVALNPSLIEMYPFCNLKKPANVLIMPNMETGSISCKFMKELGGANVIGPVLIGTEKPVQIMQMTSGVSEILNLAILVAST